VAEPGTQGSRLRGVSPPFTPSGKAAMLRSRTGLYAIGRPTIGGHSGLLLRWRTDARAVAALLPRPLEPTEESETVMCFLNRTQTGLNLFEPEGDTSHRERRSLNPMHVNWFEAIFFLSCAFESQRTRYTFAIYKDVDHGVLLGLANGYHTKLAQFHVRFPDPGQAGRHAGEATRVRMTVSRFGHLVIDASFTPLKKVSAAEIQSGPAVYWLASTAGVRYFADQVGFAALPLVQDIVLREQRTPTMQADAPAVITQAWSGSAKVVLGSSDLEGLGPLAPREVVSAHFIDLPTLSGPRTASSIPMTRVLFDYISRRT
jgi:hypothetical protein